MIVRFAGEKDEEQILNLLDQLLAEVNLKGGFNKTTEGKAPRKKIFAELLAREDVKMFVVDEGGKLLGFCDFFIVPVVRRGYLQGHIEDLVVDESARGRGVGTLLLKKLIQFSRERGIKVIKLTSGLELVDAHKFYGKNGFKFTEKMFRFDV